MIQDLINKNVNPERESISSRTKPWLESSENGELLRKLCAVCIEQKPIDFFQTQFNADCTHQQRTICDSCMYEYVRSTWNTSSDINCPECSIPLSHPAIQLILFNFGDTTLYERYIKFDLERSLEQNPEFIWCAHGCGSGQLNEGATMTQTVQCVNCQKLSCFSHRCPWHDGMTCEEYDMPRINGQVHASERWICGHTKACPKCHSHIEKNEGCDHMTCLKCKYEFCWECLVSYAGIKRHGAYLHDRTCKHYPTRETRTIFKRFIDLF